MLQRGNDGFIQDAIREEWEAYKRHVEAMPSERRHQTLHTGHCAFLPADERKFITPSAIRIDASGDQSGFRRPRTEGNLLLPPRRQNFRRGCAGLGLG